MALLLIRVGELQEHAALRHNGSPALSPSTTCVSSPCWPPIVTSRCANLPGSTWTYTNGMFCSS